MAKMREIRRRIKAVGNIQRITKTMQMIATARFQAAQSVVTQSKAFARKIGEMVGELASSLGGDDDPESVAHPLLRSADSGGRRLLLVLTSQRGLCGAYNAGVLRASMAFIRDHGDDPIDLEVVGKKGMAFFQFNGMAVSQFHTQFSDRPGYGDVEQLAQRYMDEFAGGRYRTAHVAYMAFETIARQSPRVVPLLPLSELTRGDAQERPAGYAPGKVDYEFSPDPRTLLDELLPITVKTELFQRFNEAVLGEHVARMIAMKNATDSAGKMGKQLKLRFNRARQAAITTELTEIIGGTAALS